MHCLKTEKGIKFNKAEVEIYTQNEKEFQFFIKNNSTNSTQKSISELLFVSKGAYYLDASSTDKVGHSH